MRDKCILIVRTSEKFRGHVDRGAYNGACHHGLGLAEIKICECATILIVKLLGRKRERERESHDHSTPIFNPK